MISGCTGAGGGRWWTVEQPEPLPEGGEDQQQQHGEQRWCLHHALVGARGPLIHTCFRKKNKKIRGIAKLLSTISILSIFGFTIFDNEFLNEGGMVALVILDELTGFWMHSCLVYHPHPWQGFL